MSFIAPFEIQVLASFPRLEQRQPKFAIVAGFGVMWQDLVWSRVDGRGWSVGFALGFVVPGLERGFQRLSILEKFGVL